jgi:predicted nucleic acid-binding Zn ribbon protein
MPTGGLQPAQRDLVANAAVPSYWQELHRRTRSRRRTAYTTLVQRIQPNGLQPTLRTLIAAKLSEVNRWDVCSKGTTATPNPESGTFAPRGQHPDKAPRKGQSGTFAPLAIRGANVPPTVPVPGEVAHPSEVPSEGVRRCPVCGRDITHQDPRSRVCSERLYGKAGKRCRNTLSNRTLSLRRMDLRSVLLFDQRPFIRPPQHGNTAPQV